MALTLCSDLSAAGWLTDTDQPWEELVTFGPTGFPAYARLRFLPDPTGPGQSENDAEVADDAPAETAQLRAVLDVLARYTRTPDDCYFCLWDGWEQQVHPGDRDRTHAAPAASGAVPGIDPAFSRPPPPAPTIVVPHRAYFLFRGAVSDLGDWGPGTAGAGGPEAFVPDPAFIWPADRAWCIAKDVDPHWAGIGADHAAVDELIVDSRVDVVRADPAADQPRYR